MSTWKRRLALLAIPAALVVLVGTGVAAASPGASPSTSSPGAEKEGTEQADSGKNEQQPAYTGSIPVPENHQASSEADEAKALQSLARISADAARAAAVARYPDANVQTVKLESENGYLVYSVQLTSGGKSHDVKVDAGDAKVLSDEPGDEGQASASERD